MSESSQPIYPLNDLGYELPPGVLDMDDADAVSEFLESQMEKAR